MTSVFLSYSWDSKQHKTWVADLGAALRGAGLEVKLDQDDLRPGSDLTAYIESAVRESHYVLLICTPDFAARADGRVGGVGYEQAIVTGEIFSGVSSPEKFIPILRGDPQSSVPSFIRNRVWVDFRNDKGFETALNELLSALRHETSKSASTSGAPEAQRSSADLDEDLRVYEEAVAFARSKSGLAMTKADAIDFAETCQESWELGAFRTFVDVFTFANSSMNLSRSDAEVFGLNWMERDDYELFEPYRDAFEFAVSGEGMGLRVNQARSFAEEFDQDPGLEYFYRFEQAFCVARNSGKSRSDAEDFAYSQL